MYKYKILITILILGVISCQSPSENEKRIKDILLHEVDFADIKLFCSDITVKEWRKNFKKITIVTFYGGCNPCYSKFSKWIQGMTAIKCNANNNILFIVRGVNEEHFIEQMDKNLLSKPSFGIVIDSTNIFMQTNNHISKEFFDSSLTINEQNKIVLVGAPFASTKMIELYCKICTQ